jgi:cytochrome c553
MFAKFMAILIFSSLLASFNVQAANPEAAKTTATTVCAGCHGAKGISAVGMFPNLAGQKADYLAAQLKAFRDKTRVNGIMNAQAAGLKDDDIANLAAYFAALKAAE